MKVVCVGDVTLDQFFFISEAEIACDIDKQNCVLGLKYGDKIPVEKIGVSIGGNAANVSCGLSKLGFSTSLVTIFGDDDRGAWLKRRLLENGVDLQFSKTVSARESNLSTVIVYKGERTILTYHALGADDWKALPSSEWIYLTSSSGRDSAVLFREILEHKSKNSVKLAFNPNKQDIVNRKSQLEQVLRYCEVAVFNSDEAQLLVGAQNNFSSQKEKIKFLLERISAIGPKTIVITDGPNGAYGRKDGQDWFCSVSNYEKVDATGAGDAFTSGFLSGFIEGEIMQKGMTWGMINSGSVVTKMGACEGLLSSATIREQIAIHDEVVVEKI